MINVVYRILFGYGSVFWNFNGREELALNIC